MEYYLIRDVFLKKISLIGLLDKLIEIQQKHDNKLEKIKLNKEIPKIEFKLNSEDSYILIQSIYVTSKTNFTSQWTSFISTIQITAELNYTVLDDQQKCIIDERRKQFPIFILTDQFQVQPIFQLNKLIKNETFTLGINPSRKFYRKLKLELQDFEMLNENYTLELTIEKFKIDD